MTAPAGVIFPILWLLYSVNHMLPSGPGVMSKRAGGLVGEVFVTGVQEVDGAQDSVCGESTRDRDRGTVGAWPFTGKSQGSGGIGVPAVPRLFVDDPLEQGSEWTGTADRGVVETQSDVTAGLAQVPGGQGDDAAEVLAEHQHQGTRSPYVQGQLRVVQVLLKQIPVGDLRPCHRERAAAVLHECGLDALAGSYAGGLPVGQARMVEVARALADPPRVLFLDEPASGTTAEERRGLAAVIRHMADEENCAVLLVEHNVAFVMELCSRVVVLDLGRVLAEGAPAEIHADPAVREAYLGTGPGRAGGYLGTGPRRCGT
ncbi:hypothetical protein OG462_03470 [Streptomyces sp. NBC_01077]|uniref:ABC transporter ATP-binding protein C-terminal domain-containing protein n=1 Tax=Streptomyces sp. NBC_01077 TaxID=2903746 RepID=UPI003864846B|nr:hypothetical protein OG462_03470 [Streptomyces sp. NBC_01077]